MLKAQQTYPCAKEGCPHGSLPCGLSPIRPPHHPLTENQGDSAVLDRALR